MNNQIIAEASIDVNEAPRQAENAQQTADSAKSLAGTANNNINNINAPEYLSPLEKLQLKIQMDSFATNYVADKDIATAEGIDFTAYDAAYQAYLAYMTPLVADMTTYSPIVRATFDSMVTAVQAEQKRFSTATQAQYNQQIKQAQTDIANGQTKYKALHAADEAMKSSVAGVADKTDQAIKNAGFASDTSLQASQAASSAVASAMSAESNASSAVSIADSTASEFGPVKQKADSALSDASSAVATANSTASEFGKVSQKTDNALASALNAQSEASDAVKQASSAATDSKDAKQIAGAVSQSYKTLTDGSTMTIAELEGGLAVKLTKTDLNGYATQDWSNNQIKTTADGINGTISSVKNTVDSHTTSINDLKADSNSFKAQFTTVNNTLGKQKTDIGNLQATSKELTSGFNTLTTDNTTNKNDISQLKQTSTKLSSTMETVQTQVQNSAVGTNLAIGTGQEYAMGYGIPNTTWKDGYAFETLPTNIINSRNEILPQDPHTFWYTLDQGITYTQTIWFETDATVKDLNAAQITWYTGAGHDYQPATLINLGENKYKVYSTYMWPGKSDNNVRLFDVFYLNSAFDLSTGTYLKFGKLKLEKGSLSTDWCLNPSETATVTAFSKLSQTVDGMKSDMSKKIEHKDLNGYATKTWAQNKIKVTADDISGNLSSIKSTVDGQTTSINDLKADSSGFKSQFTKVNNTLGKHTTDIGTLKATSKELTSGFNTLTTDNNTNKNDISQLKQTAQGFSSTLETVQTQVKNSAVGTNLIVGTSRDLKNAPDAANSTWGGRLHKFSSDELSILESNQVTLRAFIHNPTTHTVNLVIWTDGGNFGVGTGVPAGTDGYSTVTAYNATSKSTGGDIDIRAYTENTAISGVQYKELKLEKGSVATDWCPNPADNATVTDLTQVKQTAEGASQLSKDNHGNILALQSTAKGLQTSVSNAATKDQLTILSSQLTNQITDLKSSTNSQFTQTASDMDLLVKKGDVVNQFNIDAGGALLQTSGANTKIVLSAPNIIFDSKNPVQIPNANIPGKLTGKTFEAGTITATTKIISSDIEASLIHSKDNSFSLNGATGDIVGPSIHAADNSWGISDAGKIHGINITASVMDISGDGKGPNFDAVNVTPDTTQGIYSRYKYTNPNVGFDVNGMGRKMYKNGYLVINGDTFLNRTIGDWSADGGGKYVYDTMYEANVIKMRAYNYTGSNVQTDDPSKTQGTISSRLDIQPSAITMGPDWSVGNPNILIDRTGRIKGGLIAANAAHSIGTTDGGDLYFMKMNKNATNVGGSSIPIHVQGIHTGNLGLNGGHTISSADGGDIYVEDRYNGGGHAVNLHVKKLYQSSLLSLKTDIKPIDPHEALTEVVKNDVMGYHFKNDKTTDPKSVSVILDDINPIPKYYTSDIFKSADGTGRNDGNIVGYLMLSIKDLNSRLQKLEGTN